MGKQPYLLQVDSKRLLTEDVLAKPSSTDDLLAVQHVGCAYKNSVDVWIGENLVGVGAVLRDMEGVSKFLGCSLVHVADGKHLGLADAEVSRLILTARLNKAKGQTHV